MPGDAPGITEEMEMWIAGTPQRFGGSDRRLPGLLEIEKVA
jgi:hypothetical protein